MIAPTTMATSFGLESCLSLTRTVVRCHRFVVLVVAVAISSSAARAQCSTTPQGDVFLVPLGTDPRPGGSCDTTPILLVPPFYRLQPPGTCNPITAPSGCAVEVAMQFEISQGQGQDPWFLWFDGSSVPSSCNPFFPPGHPSFSCTTTVGFCGAPGGTIVNSTIGEAFIRLPGVKCSDLSVRDVYSVGTYTCPTSGSRGPVAEANNIQLGGTPMGIAIGCFPLSPPEWDAGSCPLSPLGGTSPIGSLGGHGATTGINVSQSGAGINVQGRGIAITPHDSGPRLKLRYFAGGVGHPGFPGTSNWTPRLGRYWSHAAAQRIFQDPNDAQKVWLLTGEGNFRSFRDTDGDQIEWEQHTPITEFRRLSKVGSYWELRYLDGVVSRFAVATGLWTENEDPNQNVVEATYNLDPLDPLNTSTARLDSVLFSDGIREVFTYENGGAGRLHSIEQLKLGESPGRMWIYEWSGDDLLRITRPDQTKWQFSYGAAGLPGYMTFMTLIGNDGASMRGERGWKYDTLGHVTSTWRGDLDGQPLVTERWQFAYSPPTSATPTTVTVTGPPVTGPPPTSDVTVYTLDWPSTTPGMARPSQIVGECPGCGFSGTTLFDYSGSNPLLPTKITDNTHETLLEYDENGHVIKRIDPPVPSSAVGRETIWKYDDPDHEGLLTNIEQPSTSGAGLRETLLGYNADAALTSRTIKGTEAGGTFIYTTNITPTVDGVPDIVDPPGTLADQTNYDYHPSPRNLLVSRRTAPTNLVTDYEYDEYNRVQMVTDPNLTTTETTYDDLDRVVEVRVCGDTPCGDQDDLVTSYQYDKFGDLFLTTLPRENVIEYLYDHVGRIKEIHRKLDAGASTGERTVYEYDAAGNRSVERRESPNGTGGWIVDAQTTTQYISQCHVDSTLQGSAPQSVTKFQYDCKGLLTNVWDANHQPSGNPSTSTQYAYDPLDRLISVTQPRGVPPGEPAAPPVVTQYEYDPQDHLKKVTDGEGNATSYTYSDRDLLTEEQSPASGNTSLRYDPNGNLIRKVDGRGKQVDRIYDAADRLDLLRSCSTVPGACASATIETDYQYDPKGWLSRIVPTLPAGLPTIDYDRDGFGRLTMDGALLFGHDENGNRTSITYPGSAVAAHTYDFADRPLTLTLDGVPVADAATYKSGGPLASLTLGNGLIETRGFDQRYFPTSILVSGGLLNWTYPTVDGVGNVTSINDGAETRSFTYLDHQYFLHTANGPWGNRTWTYDRIGNRLTEINGTETDVYTYIANGVGGRTPLLDVVQQGAGDTRDYDFTTQSGHLSSINRAGNLITLTSDDLGRLVQVGRPNAPSTELVSFSYDGRDFLSRAGVGQTLCTLDVDGDGPSDLAEKAFTDGVLIYRWLFGFSGDALTNGAVDPACTRCTSEQIIGYLTTCDALSPPAPSASETGMIDADGNNDNAALSDGVLILRYLLGFTGDALVSGAVEANCTRCTGDPVVQFLENFDDGRAPGTADPVPFSLTPEPLSGRIVRLSVEHPQPHGSLEIDGIASGPGDSFKDNSSTRLTLALDDPAAPSRAPLVSGAWAFTIEAQPNREVTLRWEGEGLERSALFDLATGTFVPTDGAAHYTFTSLPGERHFVWALLSVDAATATALDRQRHRDDGKRLVSRAVATQTAILVYDSAGMLHKKNNDLVLYFADRPVAVGVAGALTYLTTDHLGTPILATTLSAGQKNKQAALKAWPPGNRGFEPFGRDDSGTATDQDVFLRLPGQWVDKAWQEATLGAELYYNVHRWYEHQTGRYTTPDPLGIIDGDSNLYAYAQANPLSLTDTLGLRSRLCCKKVPRVPADHCFIQIERNGQTNTCGLHGGRFAPGEEPETGRIRRDKPFDDPDDSECGPWGEDCQDDCVVQAAQNYANPSPYNAFLGPNSNTFAATVGGGCGLELPEQHRWVRGWDHVPAAQKKGRERIPSPCRLP